MMKKVYQNPAMTLVATEFSDVLTSSVQHAAKGRRVAVKMIRLHRRTAERKLPVPKVSPNPAQTPSRQSLHWSLCRTVKVTTPSFSRGR